MKKEKGGKRGKKKMEERQEEREKEGGELEERIEEGTEQAEERIEDKGEGFTEEACKEDERCEEESECHSAAKRAKVCSTFTDSQEHAIVEFVKEHQSCTTRSIRVSMTDRGRRLSGQKSLQN